MYSRMSRTHVSDWLSSRWGCLGHTRQTSCIILSRMFGTHVLYRISRMFGTHVSDWFSSRPWCLGYTFVDRFYITLYSALEQTHFARIWSYTCQMYYYVVQRVWYTRVKWLLLLWGYLGCACQIVTMSFRMCEIRSRRKKRKKKDKKIKKYKEHDE